MYLKKVLIGVIFATTFFGGFSATVQADTCADIGASCRPGWISGCGSTEFFVSNACPSDPNGALVCCQQIQGVNDCTNAGGVCRSDYYAVNFPGEPACGYNGDVQSSDSCGGPAMICCVPPPNIGAACNSGAGTCQLPGNCVGGGTADAACFGGAICCTPSLGSLSVPGGCTISAGASDCSVFISWSVINAMNPSLTRNGVLVSNAASSPGEVVVLEHGLNIFELIDGSTTLSTRPSSATCDVGTSWDGTKCAVDVTHTLTVPLSCNIAVGQSTCDITISWSITGSTAPTVSQNGTVFSLSPTGNNVVRTINHGTTLIDLADNGTVLDTAAVDGYCAPGSTWDGSVCAANGSSTLSVPLSCTVPIGQSTCDITISWNVVNPVNPRVEQDGGLISLAPSSPGTTVTLTYGTTSLFDLWNNGAVIDTAPSDAYCVAGSSWDGSVCAAAAASACTGDTGKTGVCRNFCNPGENSDGIGTCTGLVCCIAPATGGTCKGDLTGKDGVCRSVCQPTEDTESDWANCGSDSCCTPKPAASTCAAQSGVCRSSCDLSTEDFLGSTSDCTFPQIECCRAKSGGSGGGSGGGGGAPGVPVPVIYGNPLKWDTAIPFLTQVMLELQKLIATLAIIMIVIGGLIYITSAGDSSRTEWAKRCILGALIGLGLGIAAPMFFKEIADLLGWTPVGLPAATNTLLGTAMGVVNFLLSVIGILAIIMLVIGAFMYLTAAGDESRIDTGKEIVKYSVIGIAVALSALVLIRLVVGFF